MTQIFQSSSSQKQLFFVLIQMTYLTLTLRCLFKYYFANEKSPMTGLLATWFKPPDRYLL